MTPLLYSTNVFLKQHIQEKYHSDVHYVWCSEYFDSKTVSPYSVGSLVPASSNPADIYRELKSAYNPFDIHCPKIIAQQASFKSLAVNWEASGKISATDRDDIIYMTDHVPKEYWRPLIYVISRAIINTSRIQLVPLTHRAGFGNEFIISDLQRNEFDIIEV